MSLGFPGIGGSGSGPASSLAASDLANPSATIGLTAVNGTAATAARSDGAPALSQSITPTWTGLHIFNGQEGIGASPATSNVDASCALYVTRTTQNGSGTTSLTQHVYYSPTTVDNTQVTAAGLFDVVNPTSYSSGPGHWPALIGRATDTATGAMNMAGVEGKVVRNGTSDVGSAVWGIYDLNVATVTAASSRIATSFNAWAEVYNGTPASTIAGGTHIAYNVTTCSGGDPTKFYALFAPVNYQIQVGGQIQINDQSGHALTLSTAKISGSDSVIQASANLYLQPTGGTCAVIGSFLPFTNPSPLGGTSNRWQSFLTTIDQSGLTTNYNGVATTGWGHPAIYGTGRVTARTSAAASIATYTVGVADGSFLVSANVNVTAATTASFTCTCTYTDETNTSRTLTLTFSNITGTLLSTITNVTGTGAYEGVQLHIRCKASTAITFATVGTFTSVTYNVEGIIQQIA